MNGFHVRVSVDFIESSLYGAEVSASYHTSRRSLVLWRSKADIIQPFHVSIAWSHCNIADYSIHCVTEFTYFSMFLSVYCWQLTDEMIMKDFASNYSMRIILEYDACLRSGEQVDSEG